MEHPVVPSELGESVSQDHRWSPIMTLVYSRKKEAGARTLFHILSMHDSLFTHCKTFLKPFNASSLVFPRYCSFIIWRHYSYLYPLFSRSIIITWIQYIHSSLDSPIHNVRRDTWVYTSLRQMTPLSRWHMPSDWRYCTWIAGYIQHILIMTSAHKLYMWCRISTGFRVRSSDDWSMWFITDLSI